MAPLSTRGLLILVDELSDSGVEVSGDLIDGIESLTHGGELLEASPAGGEAVGVPDGGTALVRLTPQGALRPGGLRLQVLGAFRPGVGMSGSRSSQVRGGQGADGSTVERSGR